MLISNTLPRVFLYDQQGSKLVLSDPSITMQPEAVLNMYAQTYPELTTAKIEGPEIKNDRVEYIFQAMLGTKG
ncbi:MAG TPA: PRTRC system protein C [Sediminibacterium sp.]|jgi:PRTRC genetic system protein C|uniref:PRTRC system protein C n=1 Tax=unclassified Sediminibacterium TaxID=2635961 RepID=UPI0008D7F934|nr:MULTISPECIES: PRTRC system protein C [unclassified Sediminibacterium]OHC85225.1 MAG: PRTRC system protein C [Sphingobacteriia bacterium RIFOXYC2_FULL_35_18]OHC89131.1 MAG: PRTRC system protein C [Sphingobacteriia bacterium RIFOXYD2_FULL_35_12]OYZ03085.1 MAG: PRTRC system protein C [Sphingobacteriia bacterium 28-36-52]MBW0160058.1 PRTRC system protein C [Sediminibacterium sp.]MBW0164166.1 PRTRC system protein C [Sediminibacterium sp.]